MAREFRIGDRLHWKDRSLHRHLDWLWEVVGIHDGIVRIKSFENNIIDEFPAYFLYRELKIVPRKIANTALAREIHKGNIAKIEDNEIYLIRGE